MYNDLLRIVKNDPEGARSLRKRMQGFIRKPSRCVLIGQLLDSLGSTGFVDRAAKLSGSSDEACSEVSVALHHVLSFVILTELLWQVDGCPEEDVRLAEDDDWTAAIENTLESICEFDGALPGLISHYDSLGVRNVHDQLILNCLKLGYLQASSAS